MSPKSGVAQNWGFCALLALHQPKNHRCIRQYKKAKKDNHRYIENAKMLKSPNIAY